MKQLRVQVSILVVLLGLLGFVVTDRQAIVDWSKLRGYTPPATVTLLATEDTMTDKARHLLYVNKPQITKGTTFTSNCPAGGEKTIVLGCYVGNDNGIYVYEVDDPRLEGVEQVTTAHEMLHAAYRRLPAQERTQVDAMLQDFYQHHLQDQRIKDIIAAYQQSEPHDVVNEMHSIFGTEVRDLPAPLEAYYRQYFSDRSRVAAYAAKYQDEFTSRQTQVAQYDTQLKQLKTQIDTNQTSLTTQKANIDAMSRTLESERAAGQFAAYNSGVPAYNQAVTQYRALVITTNQLIDQYNSIVQARNAIVLEAQQLNKELSATAAN